MFTKNSIAPLYVRIAAIMFFPLVVGSILSGRNGYPELAFVLFALACLCFIAHVLYLKVAIETINSMLDKPQEVRRIYMPDLLDIQKEKQLHPVAKKGVNFWLNDIQFETTEIFRNGNDVIDAIEIMPNMKHLPRVAIRLKIPSMRPYTSDDTNMKLLEQIYSLHFTNKTAPGVGIYASDNVGIAGYKDSHH